MAKCPICGTPMVNVYRDILDGWCTMEDLNECPKKHYSSYYATGSWEESVNGKVILATCYDRKPTTAEMWYYKSTLWMAKQKYKLGSVKNGIKRAFTLHKMRIK